MDATEPRIYTTSVLQSHENDDDLSRVRDSFRKFIHSFNIDGSYIYRDKVIANVSNAVYGLHISMEHIITFDPNVLGPRLTAQPSVVLPLLEETLKEYTEGLYQVVSDDPETAIYVPYIQIIIDSEQTTTSLRDLGSEHVSKFVRVPGIVISASSLSSKATSLQLMCRECRNLMRLDVKSGLSGLQMPRRCEGRQVDGETRSKDCGPDPYVVVHDKSRFIDQQVLKLQESPEMVPVGEVPRNIILTVDRTLTNKFVPGTRCTFMGIYSVYDQKGPKTRGGSASVAIRNPYLQVVGYSVADSHLRGEIEFSEQETKEIIDLSRTPDLFAKFARSIAPSIYGHEDIKKSIACLLFGGSPRILPDGMRLRGDINVLLMGDPGTAKSQLLKFVDKVAPICIYTSGKGSSAAGLTASVQRDAQTRDFYLEGGAMVLADGGVVCIDEFDKMREDDRVAIHEAMEQQTISIAKAGITTVLNSRTSVLAAANPIDGRYNESKTPGENIDFASTILSRFDMIYVIKDAHNAEFDKQVADHVFQTHLNYRQQGRNDNQEVEGEISLEMMRRYVTYARTKCAPRLTKEASQRLADHFVGIRKEVHEHETFNNVRSSVPITVRQLEALVRITEAIAKVSLSTDATEEHVDEALRLFSASTMDALQKEHTSEDVAKQVRDLEDAIKQRLRVGYSAEYDSIRREFCEHSGHRYSDQALNVALRALEGRGVIQFRRHRKLVHRVTP